MLLRYAAPLLVCLSVFGQNALTVSGLADHQVIQRDASGRGTVRVNGAATTGRIEMQYVPEGAAPGAWTRVADAENSPWTGELKDIPAGGPYRIGIRTGAASTWFEDIYVGDLWILAGQSNMEGVGDLVDVQKPNPMVHSFDMFDQWTLATEPLHSLPGAVDRIHWRKNAQGELERLTGDALATWNSNRKKGAGLGLPFAVEMVLRTGIPVGLVPCAHGGTSMDQWSPELRDRDGDSLYGAMLRRFRAVGGRVAGVLWYQGESDANPKDAPLFEGKFERLVRAIRTDFDQPDLPFYYVQIGRHIDKSNLAPWNSVQESQLRAEAIIPHSGMVASVDSSLDDGIHVSTPDLKRLGRRMAVLATHDLFSNLSDYGQLKRGPRPVSATFADGVLKLTFDQVNGRLQAPGRIAGFTIHAGPTGDPVPLIYKARFDPTAGNVIYLHIGGKLPENAVVWYGSGKDPYCNVTDSKDMGMPVFGPLPVELR